MDKENSIKFGAMIKRIGADKFEQYGVFKFVTTPRKGEYIELGIDEKGLTFRVEAVFHAGAHETENVKKEGDLFLVEIGPTASFFNSMNQHGTA